MVEPALIRRHRQGEGALAVLAADGVDDLGQVFVDGVEDRSWVRRGFGGWSRKIDAQPCRVR